MDTSINAINSVSTSTQKTQAVDKQSEKIKEYLMPS